MRVQNNWRPIEPRRASNVCFACVCIEVFPYDHWAGAGEVLIEHQRHATRLAEAAECETDALGFHLLGGSGFTPSVARRFQCARRVDRHVKFRSAPATKAARPNAVTTTPNCWATPRILPCLATMAPATTAGPPIDR
jgi:hypothetical protein